MKNKIKIFSSAIFILGFLLTSKITFGQCPSTKTNPNTKRSPEYWEAVAEMRQAKINKPKQVQQDTVKTTPLPKPSSNQNNTHTQNYLKVQEDFEVMPGGRWYRFAEQY